MKKAGIGKYCFICRPTLSSWEPETVVGAAVLHVGERSSGLVAGQLVDALAEHCHERRHRGSSNSCEEQGCDRILQWCCGH